MAASTSDRLTIATAHLDMAENKHIGACSAQRDAQSGHKRLM